jgi:hypothetical protein
MNFNIVKIYFGENFRLDDTNLDGFETTEIDPVK